MLELIDELIQLKYDGFYCNLIKYNNLLIIINYYVKS